MDDQPNRYNNTRISTKLEHTLSALGVQLRNLSIVSKLLAFARRLAARIHGLARAVSLADVLGPGRQRRDSRKTDEKCVVVRNRDSEIVVQGARLPVGSGTVPDTEVSDAGGLEGSGYDENVGQADGTPDVFKRDHFRAGLQVVLMDW